MSDLWEVVVVWATRPTALSVAGGFVGCAVLFGTLEWWFGSCRSLRRGLRGVATDVAFWAITPLVTKAVTYSLLAAAVGLLLDGSLPDTLISRQPFWLQFLQVTVIGVLIYYRSHRPFHRPPLWPMHAVHHSPTELDWLSAMRLHPLNDLATRTCQALPILTAGYDPGAVVLYIPLVVFWVILSHADLPWTFGSAAILCWCHPSSTGGTTARMRRPWIATSPAFFRSGTQDLAPTTCPSVAALSSSGSTARNLPGPSRVFCGIPSLLG